MDPTIDDVVLRLTASELGVFRRGIQQGHSPRTHLIQGQTDLRPAVTSRALVEGGTLNSMYCADCDWLFSPTKAGLIPKHAGAGMTWSGLQQNDCRTSGKSAVRYGLRKPQDGNSKTMLCRGCDTRQKRSGRDGRINTHQYQGTSCAGGRPSKR